MFTQPFVYLIFIGLAFKAAGFLVRDELVLRGLILCGSGFDIAFYLLQTPPIFGPVVTSLTLISINGFIISVIVIERSTLFMSAREKEVFRNFETLSPGQFRRVIRMASWSEATEETVLLQEDAASDNLYFIESDSFSVTKRGARYNAAGPAFAGEIMLLHGGTASATVSVPAGAVYATWEASRLRRAMDKSRTLRNAVVARFSQDMAQKVRNSVPLEARTS